MILITLVSLQSNASDPEGIKLNNEAVKMLEDAIKAKGQANSELNKSKQPSNTDNEASNLGTVKDKKEKGVMSKLLELMVGDSEKTASNDDQENKSEEKTEEANEAAAEINSGEFLPAKSKDKDGEEDKSNDVDEDVVFKAHKKILQATRKSGELAEIRMNLGLSFELSDDIENSYKAYNMAERAAKNSPSLEFMARYNKARVLAAQKKIPLALAQYQAALELNPKSLEVKVNIELLIQSQQGGGGGGEGEKKDKEGEQGKEPKPDAPIKKSPKNSEYKSQKLSKKNVEKILEELKNQEQKIREKEYNKGVKEKSRDKDW